MASTAGLSGSTAQGVAVGFGRVSVATKFFPAITSLPYPGYVASQNPTVKSFHNRLAWLVVFHTFPIGSFCPLERAPVGAVAPRASDHDYSVFLIDARTGSDALVYREGGPGGCTPGARVPPNVTVAKESASVPWTLVSRNPDGYSGTISATILPCERAPNLVLVDRAGPDVDVEVTRPYGPPCGRTETVLIPLHAAMVTADLPAVIGHDPVGLTNLLSLPTSTPPETSRTTTTTSLPLVSVDASDRGHTFELTVGQVLTVQPVPGTLGGSFTSPAVSTDPAVLGPLTASPQPLVAEFRAWREGTAEITVPQSACIRPTSGQSPCTGPFVVYVVVRTVK